VYPLTLNRVYFSERVERDKRAWERMNKMAKAIGLSTSALIKITDAELPDIVAENNWQNAWIPQGMRKEQKKIDLVFNAFKFNNDERQVEQTLKSCPSGTPRELVKSLLGYCTPVYLSHSRIYDKKVNCVCWSENEFITIEGCPHGCKYCPAGQLININLNLEDFIEKVVIPTLKQNAWQKCFRCNTTASDTICFEPEYGLHELVTRKFAEFRDKYLYIHTKSANVDFIKDLKYRNRIIMVWSITSDRVSREIESGTATALERVEAARKCQEMGIPIRYKFKPIIPLSNWRQEYSAIIEEMFRRTNPEAVGFCVLMWMDAERFHKIFNPAMFDPLYISRMEESKEEMKGISTGPFPHDVRKEIYQFFINEIRKRQKSVPLFISTESREMWDDLKNLLGVSPSKFICGCGPVCLPGPRLAKTATSTYGRRTQKRCY